MTRKIVVAILWVSIVVSVIQVAKAKNKDFKLEKEFEYSVTPVDEQWAEFSSHKEMLEVCQLPYAYLKEVSTEELLDKVKEYPLIIDILNYDDLKSGVNAVAKQFNGLQELLSREDLTSVILTKYRQAKIPTVTRYKYDEKNVSNGSFLDNRTSRLNIYLDMQDELETVLYEGILLQDIVAQKYSIEKKLSIIKEVAKKAFERSESKVYDYKSESMFISSVYEEKNSLWWDALKQETISDNSNIKKQRNNKTLSLNIHNISIKNRKGDSTTYVKTPNGTKVKCIIKSDNHVNSAAFVAKEKSTYPKATVVGPGYSGNNCHAYAWTGQQDIWMPNPIDYVSDKSYKKITTGRPSENGQKAVWGNYNHSGIVMDYTKQDPIITSKWGGKCIMKCNASYVPYDGNIVYYKRNK